MRAHKVRVPGETTPALVSELAWSLGAAPPRQRLIDLDLTNVAALNVNLAGAGLAAGEAGSLAVRSDGSSSITLARARPGTTIRLDGVEMGHAGQDGRFAVKIPAGRHEVAVTRDST